MKNEDRKYKVIISDKAADMLIEHIRFLAEVSTEAAENLQDKIITSSKSLQHFPKRNPWITDPVLALYKYRKMVVDKRYMLIYQIKDEIVFVDYILDCRRHYRWLL